MSTSGKGEQNIRAGN